MQTNALSPNRALWAYVGPFALFILLQAVPDLLKSASHPAFWWLHRPEFWVYPLQAGLCAVMMLRHRREYPHATTPLAVIFGLIIGAAVFALWVSPQVLFEAAPRNKDGFDPGRIWWFRPGPYAFAAVVTMRFVRLALVVPWLEEIFWRGFLLRYLVKEDFLALPFGSWTPLSFGVVVLGFAFEHSRPDWPAAFATGILYNLVAVRTKSLPACVLAHALTNALLGWYVMTTHQWGFW